MSLSKHLRSILSLSAIIILFTQCESKKENQQNSTNRNDTNIQTDTIYVHDTVYIKSSGNNTGNSVHVSADKMNVFYIGVDNPISIQTNGISVDSLQVGANSDDISIKPGGRGHYRVTATKAGQASIEVRNNDINMSFPFRVKRIPDPQARLSGKSGGQIGTGEFKAQGGVGAFLDNFDFDAVCQVTGFELTYIPKRGDAIQSQNVGPRYNDKSRSLVNRAKPGDTYLFTNVRSKCPGDVTSRKINSMAFLIK